MTSIIIKGNPVDGLRFFGPFKSSNDAIRWGEKEDDEFDWWIDELIDPELEDEDDDSE